MIAANAAIGGWKGRIISTHFLLKNDISLENTLATLISNKSKELGNNTWCYKYEITMSVYF